MRKSPELWIRNFCKTICLHHSLDSSSLIFSWARQKFTKLYWTPSLLCEWALLTCFSYLPNYITIKKSANFLSYYVCRMWYSGLYYVKYFLSEMRLIFTYLARIFWLYKIKKDQNIFWSRMIQFIIHYAQRILNYM